MGSPFIGNFTAGDVVQAAFPGLSFPVVVTGSGVDNFKLVLSGGVNNTPTAGAARVVLYVASVGALTS
jgi:hypothetical protein